MREVCLNIESDWPLLVEFLSTEVEFVQEIKADIIKIKKNRIQV